ncbi:MAG TPA: type II and III secretion system protein family protein [Hyphomicrobiaceae bacterium]|nr:type II and III secretion system protein family protein [Hyphomicrobiaceae bacterium]
MFESTFNLRLGIRRLTELFLLALAVCLGASGAVAQSQQAPGFISEPVHRSYLRVPANVPLPATRRITIGVDKSMLIDLPIDLENVLVSNPEVVNAVVKSQRQIYLLGKDQGEANAFFMGPNGQKILLLEIVVARDLTALNETLHRLLPGAKITVDTMGDNVVLSGSVLTPADANRAAELAQRAMKKKDKDSVVNLLTVAEPAKEQVLLKVTVAEMQREALRRLGVDFPNAVLQSGNFTFQKIITNSFPVTAAVAPTIASGAKGAGGSFGLANWQTGNQSVTAIVEALERTGLMRTLAEPNLTALSGETAKFLAGGEFPIPLAGRDGDISVEFKQFGVSTTFKPLVLSDGRISLSIGAEVSELTTEGAVIVNNLSIPALKVRRAETTLEMPSGGTLAMAGMLSDDTRQNVDGVPGLKNIPVLGQLFRSNDYRRRETELVILVTPYIATHMSKAQAAKPDKNFAPASDLKSIFFGHMHRLYGPIGDSLEGEFGFIIAYPDAGTKG